jgi:hypothetical protein
MGTVQFFEQWLQQISQNDTVSTMEEDRLLKKD